jgi:serine phosphatase RsbU (regulator of sigma subunit)
MTDYRLFLPVTAMMNRLKYPQKFALISLIFILPLGLVVTLLLTEIQSRSTLAQREQMGNAYLRSLRQLWLSVPQVQLMETEQTDDTREQQAQVTSDFKALESTDRQFGSTLQTTPQFQAIAQSWQLMLAHQGDWSPETKIAESERLLQQIDALRTQVGNQSNLILDPDLDTYYLMDTTLEKLPVMQRHLAEIKALSQGVFARRQMTLTERGRLIILVTMLKSHNVELKSGLEQVFQTDPSGQMRRELGPLLEDFTKPTQHLVATVEELLYEHKIPEADRYVSAADRDIQASLPLWDKSMEHLDRLLQKRLDGFTQKQQLVSLSIFLLLLAVLYLFIGFYRGMMQTVSSLSVASQQMIDGTLTEAVVLDSRDELAEVVRSFNQIAKALVHSHQEVITLNQRLEGANLRMGGELDVTRRLQEMMLPRPAELQEIKDLDISGFMKPASEVGGDYYDVLSYNGQVKIGIGDVTGHGLESGMLMIMVQTAVRTLLESGLTDPIKFLDVLNRTIYGNVQRMESDKNMTLALVDYADGVLKLSGQHEEMIVVRNGGDVERIDTMDLGFPIGLEENIEDFINATHIQLSQGDGVVLYTDGITEAENMAGVQYGMDRLCDVVSQQWHRPAEEIRHAVIADLHQYIGEQTVYDDITLLICKQK